MKDVCKRKASDLNKKYREDIILLMPGHVYWKDKNGVFLGCNLQQANDAGFATPTEMIGKTDFDMPWSIQADYLQDIDRKVMQAGRPLTLEELFELPDGTKKIYLSKKIPLYDDNNQASGVLGISFDITDRKQLEENLVKAKELAESANMAKTEFLENMRHDIRTPLTGIVGFAEIIKKEAKNPQVKEYADNLVSASHRLLEFLNEILDAIKVLTGDIPQVKKKFSLPDIATKIVQLVKPKALEKKLNINLNIDKKIPKYVKGDPVRIYRILLELVSNALNFTDKGKVSINLKLAKKEGRELVISCSIQDTGIGIPAEKQDEIFLRFKRLTPAYKGIYKGAGLGLAVVKQFIDDLQGEIYCQSEEGKGSTFICLMPLLKALLDDDMGVADIDKIKDEVEPFTVSDRKKSQPKKPLGKTHILLVEDQYLAAKVAEAIIISLGCTVDIASDGKAALKSFQENNYDLIFMDIGLPDTDGYELTKHIRAQEWKLDRHIPIVALTAHVDSENKQRCLEYGMDAVLSKPLIHNTAKDIINAFIPGRTEKPEPKIQKIKKTKVDEKEDKDSLQIDGEIIDFVYMQENFKYSKEESQKFLKNTVLPSIAKEIILFENAYNKKDWPMTQQIAHKIGGTCTYSGMLRLRDACRGLEAYLRSSKTKLIKNWSELIMKEYRTVQDIVNKF